MAFDLLSRTTDDGSLQTYTLAASLKDVLRALEEHVEGRSTAHELQQKQLRSKAGIA
jgi:hypothetical protein